MRGLLRWLLGCVVLVVVLASTGVVWMRTDGSLSQALRWSAAWLPEGMQLTYRNASGSLINGQIEQWQWQQNQLSVKGQALRWRMDTAALWQGKLHVPELSLQSLTLHDQRPATASSPWTDLQLPLHVEVDLDIDQLASTGRIKWTAQHLRARYGYDGHAHQVQLEQLQWAQGQYRGQLQLQAQAPLALQIQLQAQVTGPGNRPLQLQASAKGQLASALAQVDMQAQLRSTTTRTRTPQLALKAQLHPWLDLTHQRAQAQWQALDLSWLWPQAPSTVLQGSMDMRVEPAPSTDSHVWHLALDTLVGQGRIRAQATQSGDHWQGQVELDRLRSTDLYHAAPDTRWSGHTRWYTSAQAVHFLANLTGQEQTGAPAHVRSQGQWTGQSLLLDTLDVQWVGLLAHGQLQAQLKPQRLSGQLQLQWPGMQGQWQGDLQAQRGQGALRMSITNPALNARWLAQWQGLPALPWSNLHDSSVHIQWLQGWSHPQASVQTQWTRQGWSGQLQLSAQSDVSQAQGQTRLSLDQLRISSPDKRSWVLQLAHPLQLHHHQTRGQWHTRWTANTLSAQGPAGHTAYLSLDDGQWGPAGHQLQLKAQDWPLAWAQTVLGTEGLSGVNVNTQASLSIQEQHIQAQLTWDSPLAGTLRAQLNATAQVQGGQWQWSAQAPLHGEVQANLPELSAWSRLAPPGWRVRGHLSSHITLSGSLAQPRWQGQASGDNIAIRSAVEGVEFHSGRFSAQLQEQQIVLKEFVLSGAGDHGGALRGQGRIVWPTGDDRTPWKAADALVQLQVVAEQLRLTNRADRRLVVSGEIDTRVAQSQLLLRGRVRADQALFVLPEDTTPTLGKDVRVLSQHTPSLVSPPPAGRWLQTPDVQVALELGEDFYVMGQGVTTRLTGQLKVSSNAQTQGQPRLQGQLQTVGGLYKAYGQNLAIEQGLLTFSGAYDNPQLNIVALRANISERVGVRVTGTALNPAIRLYADPDMPDADKLAWLVLGRSAANGGAESVVLQQAALSLLGGKNTLGSEVAQALGLDEVSLAQGSRNDASATGTALTLGKRLSKDFYMAYESSLNGTFGSLFVFYDLSRRWTLRAQAGDQNTLDLIYTIRKR